MNDEDRRLGMDRPISRRDFMDGTLRFAAGLTVPGAAASASAAAGPSSTVGMAGGPTAAAPGATGLRGSHDGAFEVAHELAWSGRRDWGPVAPPAPDDDYDLVVVGGGVSGLAAAWFHREAHPDARILILDNHDDFGGHARRNEFAWGDRTILGYGGSQSLEAPSAYSDVAKRLLAALAVDVDGLAERYDQSFYRRHGLEAAIWFDAESFGRDALVRSRFFEASGFLPLAESALSAEAGLARMPLSETAKAQLRAILAGDEDRLPGRGIFAEPAYLSSVSYRDFLVRDLGVTAPDAWALLRHLGNSYYGNDLDMVPASEALALGAPGLASTSLGSFEGLLRTVLGWSLEPYVYHFPDGNASIARLLVRSLIPAVAEGRTMDDVVTAAFAYDRLDLPASPVRIRLNSTVVDVAHDGRPADATRVDVTYVRDGRAERVRGRNVILACWNMAIPHLCPELPAAQKEALSKLVKMPMCATNVLLRDWKAIEALKIGIAYSPGRWNKTLLVEFPVSMGAYGFAATPEDPIMLHSLRGVAGEGETPEAQSRAGRYELLALSFEDYERELRRHLAGMLGPGGFDPARDIAGITVNRWPHGYAWAPNSLHDPEWADGDAPHERGRVPFGRIHIANSDAGARAYLDCAIDEAWRAVAEIG